VLIFTLELLEQQHSIILVPGYSVFFRIWHSVIYSIPFLTVLGKTFRAYILVLGFYIFHLQLLLEIPQSLRKLWSLSENTLNIKTVQWSGQLPSWCCVHPKRTCFLAIGSAFPDSVSEFF
ncbi:unnamed protein product, partial [Bubo scandiacus]